MSKTVRKSNDDLKQWISAEITNQLKELKDAINRELVNDLKLMQTQITKQVVAELTPKISYEASKVKSFTDDLRRDMDKSNNQIALTNTQQIVAVKQATRELVMQVGQQITNQVYGKVLGEINEKIVPKVNNMIEFVKYQTQDGGEINDSYRRAVHAQSNPHLDSTKLITDGRNDPQILSPHISLFFGD